MTAVSGATNDFLAGQCTYWASERYHELTGMYVPWAGNAADWAGNAPAYGWTVSNSPVAPSIICLQPSVQEASSQYGHVGVVESIDSKTGNITTSNLNWGSTPSQVTTVAHQAGPGVSFIYVRGSGGSPLFQIVNWSQTFQTALQNGPIQLAPNADVTSFLAAMDSLLNLTNPFAGINAPQDSLAGVSFTDPVAWIEGFGQNLVTDLGALILRGALILVGIIILYKVLAHFLDVGNVGANIGGLFGL